MTPAEPLCAECGLAGRYVHRYPKGEQPERSHPFAAARTTTGADTGLREALTAYRAAHSEWLDNLDEDGCPEAIALKDVLAATPASGAIDAGRLARAMWEVRGGGQLSNLNAREIAAEYNRLALPQPGEPT